ncbi:MAG: metal ABC transporter permease [gamma proteobacterium endosymbiont of Lamellibrachia anaximandri]|nr:metal ABC transporter permease [gamma proteobacterium endosymbiont of Lamellibrachia anaximandri]MBL3619613.1 metal ABC transporter permease [gamma proteobacterium endosymbiont of Lamellibrachia anaximandri]
MSIEGLEYSILGPAFIAGLLILATHVPLGQEVLKRGIIFIDLAIAQIAGLGVIAAYRFGWETHGWEVQIAAVGSALIAATALGWLEKHYQKHQEALIGVTFILAATASILLLVDNPHSGESLKDLLVGQILWITWEQLLPTALVAGLILLVLFKFKQQLNHLGFYLLFAVAVTSSVQLVGVYLVFASLIIPALGSAGHCRALLTGYIIGASGYGLGLIASSFMDLPSGAVIVWSIATIAVLFKLVMRNGYDQKA